MPDDTTTRYTVLLVDDNPDLLRALSLSLEALGNFNIVSAEDGVRGLEQFYTHHPDCIVIDVKMPGLDGYQLVQALRGDPESEATPLVMLTALAQERDQFIGLAVGADQYLVKPVKPQDLAAAIRVAIATSRDERLRRMQRLLDEPPQRQE
jgi:CheY-like chemotaxis protein